MRGHTRHVKLPIGDVRRLTEALLVDAGCSVDAAVVAADVFAEAEMRGIGLQGLDYVPYMIEALRAGRIDPSVRPVVTRDTDSVVIVDARHGIGQYAANFAVDLGIQKSSKTGASVVGLIDASELYMLGYYVERAARAKKVGIAFSTTYPLVHPWGGVEPILGTNPIAIAFPRRSANPVLIDLATSALAYGRLRQAAYYDEDVPIGSGIDARGHPTVRAKEIQQGALSPLGGVKGYALSLAVSLLCGALLGGDVGHALQDLRDGKNSTARLGHLFIIIDPEFTVGFDQFIGAVEHHISEIKNSVVAPGYDEIRIPGERAFRERELADRGDVSVLRVTWEKLNALSANTHARSAPL